MTERIDQWDLNDLLHPSQAFDSPLEVVQDADLTLNEKRAILASWASDACALDAAPWLREFSRGSVASYDDIMDALRSLDKDAAECYRRLSRSLRRRRIASADRSEGSGSPLQ
jgi:uncharacterized membrane-anchored protein